MAYNSFKTNQSSVQLDILSFVDSHGRSTPLWTERKEEWMGEGPDVGERMIGEEGQETAVGV